LNRCVQQQLFYRSALLKLEEYFLM
jgi:hypothetical protein